MSKWIALLLSAALLVVVLAFPSSAQAQETAKFSSLEIALWPEYDRPAVLVIYHITLSTDTILPASLAIEIPSAAGEPNAVAVRQADGQLFNVQYKLQSAESWSTLTFIATALEIQIEYYDPSLSKSGSQRSLVYEWPGGYAADATSFQVQQPFDASNLRLTPGPAASVIGADGLTYFNKDVGPLSASQSFRIEVTYRKASDELSAVEMQVQPVTPLAEAWQDSLMKALPWILGVFGIVLIGGGIFWYWRSGQPGRSAANLRQPRGRRRSAQPTEPGEVYCHQCGKRAAQGDRFCRSCGTRLRIE